MMTLAGKVYAITGAASGIGLATAKIIAERGGIPCLSDITPSGLAEAEVFFNQLQTPFLMTKVDVSKRDEVDSWIDEIKSKFGRLDGAANVAGVIGKDHGIKSVAELDDDEWDKIMGVNLKGLMFCLRKQLQVISAGGSIVNVSSIHGTKGVSPMTKSLYD
jgi:NAD(P)-dependent dehydrogenase (short-subunit alcohol dehydrogenase family)